MGGTTITWSLFHHRHLGLFPIIVPLFDNSITMCGLSHSGVRPLTTGGNLPLFPPVGLLSSSIVTKYKVRVLSNCVIRYDLRFALGAGRPFGFESDGSGYN